MTEIKTSEHDLLLKLLLFLYNIIQFTLLECPIFENWKIIYDYQSVHPSIHRQLEAKIASWYTDQFLDQTEIYILLVHLDHCITIECS